MFARMEEPEKTCLVPHSETSGSESGPGDRRTYASLFAATGTTPEF